MEPTWQTADGSVRLYHADCRDALQSIFGVDAIITSPPYNCGKDYGVSGDDMPLEEYWAWLEGIMQQSTATLAPWGYLCVNHANFIGSRDERQYVPDELRPVLDRCTPFRDLILWDKGPPNGAAWGNFQTSPRIRAQHENIFVHGGLAKMPPSDIGWEEWSQFTGSVWRIPTAGVDLSLHPAMMPVEVARRLCLLYSPQSGQVCDPFCGSGTTGVAAIRTGRRFIGIEKDAGHFATAVRRLSAECGLEYAEPSGMIQKRMFKGPSCEDEMQ